MNRVLIIEDDAVARRQLVQLFRFENFDVAEAECGETGIAEACKAAPNPPMDILFTDVYADGGWAWRN